MSDRYIVVSSARQLRLSLTVLMWAVRSAADRLRQPGHLFMAQPLAFPRDRRCAWPWAHRDE